MKKFITVPMDSFPRNTTKALAIEFSPSFAEMILGVERLYRESSIIPEFIQLEINNAYVIDWNNENIELIDEPNGERRNIELYISQDGIWICLPGNGYIGPRDHSLDQESMNIDPYRLYTLQQAMINDRGNVYEDIADLYVEETESP